MLYFEEHFNKHHFLHAPHKWFLAFLISPIHYLELHYKKRYHLNFEHARKLFLFDLSLLASVFVLLGLSILWTSYNPTVLNLVYLSISPSSNRVASGDYLTYTIEYKNNSSKKLINPALALEIPNTFIIDKVFPAEIDSNNKSFALNDLLPGSNGKIEISGWFYGAPDQEITIKAKLSYRQENRDALEIKTSPIIKTLRGSVLAVELIAPDSILDKGRFPLSIKLTNNGSQSISNIKINLAENKNLSVANPILNLGSIDRHLWLIEKMAAGQTAELNGVLIANLDSRVNNINLVFTPSIKINNQEISQSAQKKTFKVMHPNLSLSARWDGQIDKIEPGKTAVLDIDLKNQGNIALHNLKIEIPLPNGILNLGALSSQNHAIIKNNILSLDKNFEAGLEEIAVNSSKAIQIKFPILSYPQGANDLVLNISPRIRAEILNLNENYFETNVVSPNLKIGTNLSASGEARYFTVEGDQLGRGSLPPQVGEETKYWILLKFANNTSQIEKLNFSAHLPDYVVWTGKTSVSIGKPIVYNQSSRTVFWSINTLEPHEKAGLYFELSLTPSENQRATYPKLLQNIQITGQDAYIDVPITTSLPDIDISLPADKLARQKGTLIQ